MSLEDKIWSLCFSTSPEKFCFFWKFLKLAHPPLLFDNSAVNRAVSQNHQELLLDWKLDFQKHLKNAESGKDVKSGKDIETSCHYLLHCHNYSNKRLPLLNVNNGIGTNISEKSDLEITKVLFYGKSSLNKSSNAREQLVKITAILCNFSSGMLGWISPMW